MTSRQFYFIFIIFIISLKIQKMPCLMYDYLNKDSYILFLIYFAIDLIGIIIALFLTKKLRKLKEDKNVLHSKFFIIITKILSLFISIYFLLQSILFYEAIQDLFSHILFDNLSWAIFSLFLLGSVFYLASFNYDNIGRFCELLFSIIMGSLFLLLIFGALHTDFTSIFPFQTIKNIEILKTFKMFNFWFGDFFVVLMLGLNVKDISTKKTLLTYFISVAFVILFVIEFNGIFLDLSGMQPSLISIISEQSFLGIDIGRFDWFLILNTEIGTAICASFCLCISKKSLSYFIPKIKENYYLIFLTIVIYFVDIFYLVDINMKEKFFFNYVSIFSIVIRIATILLLITYLIKRSCSKKYNLKKVKQ